MWGQLRKLLGKTYQPLNKVELSQANLLHNYHYLSSINRKVKIAPVLKSNAYGHGLVQIAKTLDFVGAPFFCVDSLYEAYELLKAEIKTPILIMGYIDPENLKVKKLPFSYAVYDLHLLEVINKYQKGAGVHLKVDSGMNRLGVKMDDLPEFLDQLKNYPNIKVEGLMSHLADAESPGSDLTKKQLGNFNKIQELVKNKGFKSKWIHLAASGGLLNAHTHSDQGCNLARVGLALYGIGNQNLKPVLKLVTKIVQIKKIKEGEKVGYNGTFQAKKETVLGILPIGYFDGVDRRLSNLGVVLVDGVECPIVGMVSMNITTVDLSKVKNPQINQEVVIFSNNSKDPNCLEKSAQACGTIPYDLLVHLASSTRRQIT